MPMPGTHKLLHPTHTAERFLCISLRSILCTKIALQHVRLSKALASAHPEIGLFPGKTIALIERVCAHI
jgi:hypothetical protein